MYLVPAIVLAIVLPLLLGLAVLMRRALRHSGAGLETYSLVTRQHLEIFQGGPLDEAAVEAAKRRFRALLERGDLGAVEASLRPGTQYVHQVRALTEIGTDAAAAILERQLRRRLSDDPVEQAWYWIDLAGGLRALNHQESLPLLFHCAETPMAAPLGYFFAAEAVCFLGFSGYVRQPETDQGRAALQLLHRALEGLRFGVQPHLLAEGRLGEVIEAVWDHRPAGPAPLVARVLIEALRLVRRAPHARAAFADEPSEREAFEWQLSRLAALEPAFREYLERAPAALKAALATARADELPDLLRALDDLRTDAGAEVMPLLERPRFEHAELAAELLRWSKGPHVGRWLREYAARRVNMGKRAQARRRSLSPARPSVPADFPYGAILRSLRNHPSVDTERFLSEAAQDFDPLYRAAALGSLGWWEPLLRTEVLAALEGGRRDPSPIVRQTARAALARLGERAALHWFRQALVSDNPQHVHDAVQTIAAEGLTLLWPDLDRLADSDVPEIAQHSREALERLAEEMEQPQPW